MIKPTTTKSARVRVPIKAAMASIDTKPIHAEIAKRLSDASTVPVELTRQLVSVDKKDDKILVNISGYPIPIEYFKTVVTGGTAVAAGIKIVPDVVRILKKASSETAFVNRRAKAYANISNVIMKNADRVVSLAGVPKPSGNTFIRSRLFDKAYPIRRIWGSSLKQIALLLGIEILEHVLIEYAIKSIKDYLGKRERQQ